jgi:hypothetical protein
MPPPAVVSKVLHPKQGATDTNILVFPLAGIRRLHIILKASSDTRRETSDVWWYLSAWATIEDAGVNLPGVASENVNLAPSRVEIPPLGAGVMHIATAWWMGLPPASALSVQFSTSADQPQGSALALGYADTTPHNFSGLLRAPYGYPRMQARLVEPLPTDPETLDRLEIDDRIAPPLIPGRRRYG